jgi:putative methionine-R-sulfoxide reductase with GAF domain
MDPHFILDKDAGEAASQPHSQVPGTSQGAQDDMRFPAEDGGKSLAEMAERDLTATLQLLVERAQYITGATGAAIALRDHEEMVCRASAGPSAPEVGAQLQVNSGLSGESVRTRQTLRCDDAAIDTRVNRESCEALGIRSVVVMPLLRGDEVIGVFELFSDQANVFETRDLAALERMGAMVHTALEHSAAALGLEPLPADQPTHPSLPVSGNGHREEIPEAGFADDNGTVIGSAIVPEETVAPHANANEGLDVPTPSLKASPGIAFHMKMAPVPPPPPANPVFEEMAAPKAWPANPPAEQVTEEVDILEEPGEPAPPAWTIDPADDILVSELEAHAQQVVSNPTPVPEPTATTPEAEATAPPAVPASRGTVASLRKCEACGFPVSEGRQLCLDCEKKGTVLPPKAAKVAPVVAEPERSAVSSESGDEADSPLLKFLEDQPEESWIATHKLVILAIIIGIIAIVAAAMLR